MPTIRHKRGTRAALNALRDAGGLIPQQIYVITDEVGRLAVATTMNSYSTFLREDEASAAFPLLVVGKEGSSQVIPSGGQSNFTTVAIDVPPSVDTHNAWNQGQSEWTVPQDGIYDIRGKARLQDGAPSNVSYGLGLDTANRDAPSFFWSHTNEFDGSKSYAPRNGIFNARIVRLLAGERVRLFIYIDTTRGGDPLEVVASELNIVRIR